MRMGATSILEHRATLSCAVNNAREIIDASFVFLFFFCRKDPRGMSSESGYGKTLSDD